MSDLKKAIQLVKNQAKAYKAVIELSEALEDVASVEQVAAEAEKRVSVANRHAEEAEGELAKKKSEVDEVLLQIKDLKKEASEIIENAEERARELIKKAEQEYVKKIKNAEQRLTSINEDSRKALDDLHFTRSKSDTARKELAAIETRIDTLKNQIARMAGA